MAESNSKNKDENDRIKQEMRRKELKKCEGCEAKMKKIKMISASEMKRREKRKNENKPIVDKQLNRTIITNTLLSTTQFGNGLVMIANDDLNHVMEDEEYTRNTHRTIERVGWENYRVTARTTRKRKVIYNEKIKNNEKRSKTIERRNNDFESIFGDLSSLNEELGDIPVLNETNKNENEIIYTYLNEIIDDDGRMIVDSFEKELRKNDIIEPIDNNDFITRSMRSIEQETLSHRGGVFG